MISILLVDPHPLIRTGLKALLDEEAGIEVVAEAGSCQEALRAARQGRPDVVLIDTAMPGMGVVELTRRLQRLDPAPAIVGLSVQPDGPMPSCLMEVGATGYLTRHCDREELVHALRSVAAGRHYVGIDVAQSLVLGRLDPRQSPLGRLTPRELSVMLMVSEGRNRAEISTTLCLSPKTVSTYRTRLLRKLGASSDVELTLLSLRHGLIEAGATAHV